MIKDYKKLIDLVLQYIAYNNLLRCINLPGAELFTEEGIQTIYKLRDRYEDQIKQHIEREGVDVQSFSMESLIKEFSRVPTDDKNR